MNISNAKYVGRLHRENNMLNQDYVLTRRISDNVSIAVLADGVGSKKYAGKTAEHIINSVEKYCIDNASRDDFVDILKTEIFSYVNDSLFSLIQDIAVSSEDCGSTMLFVVVCEGKYVAGHIGDGIILYRNLSGFKVLSEPDNGKFINQTYFLPTKLYQEHFRLYDGEVDKEFCFIIASDGISGTLYNQVDNQVSRACEQMYQWCKMYSSEECNSILEDNLAKVFDKYTDDDKSIAIICDGR